MAEALDDDAARDDVKDTNWFQRSQPRVLDGLHFAGSSRS
jgi:hypothetical protein